jgi:colicin import membrane protein
MSRLVTPQRKNGALGVLVGYSAIAHLIVFFILLNFQFPAHFKEAPVYYVDVLDLPVAHPQAGTPSGAEHQPAPPQPAPPQPAAPAPREMTLPSKPAAKTPLKQTTAIIPKQPEAPDTAREFEERIARLEREAAARHEAAALEALKKRAGSKGPIGMPGATGNEAGSDYASYIRSRLEDAFRKEDTFKPDSGKVVIARLTIDQNGRIVNQRYEQRSNDRMFDDAVARAIARAEKEFKRPPGGGQFEHVFVFKPQGVGKK